MHYRIVGIFSYPWNPDYQFGQTPLSQGSPMELYRKMVWLKANPRPEAYMKTLFFEQWPTGIFVNADNSPDWMNHISRADTVILLYPDAIGQGFRHIEDTVRKIKKPGAAMRVLNGRRRKFLLNRSVQMSLRLRRLLERLMLLELLVMVPFIIITPFLAIFDRAKGHQ